MCPAEAQEPEKSGGVLANHTVLKNGNSLISGLSFYFRQMMSERLKWPCPLPVPVARWEERHAPLRQLVRLATHQRTPT